VSDDKQFDANKFSDELHDQIHRDIHARLIPRPSRPMGGLFWGAFLTFVGVVLLLNRMGIISVDHLWKFWPLFLVVAGISNMFAAERRFWGIILVIAGVLLQLNQLGIAHFGWADFWPIVLIAAGVLVMWGSLGARTKSRRYPSVGGDPRTTVVGAAIFSGLERRVTTQDFQGGNVTAIFGGVELDLTEAGMQADEATLEITAIFGGAEIRVPESWLVSYRGAPIFGGVEDKTRTRRSENLGDSKRKVLTITGAVIFGGLEIKN
jgi:predicted membrane protein